MSEELNLHLTRQARELCVFYDYLNFLDQGILLNLIAALGKDAEATKKFANKLGGKKKYNRFTKNPLLA